MLSTDQLAELMAKKQQDQTDEEFVDEGYTAEWDSDEKQGDETDFMAKLKAAMAEREKEESSPETTPEPEPVPKWRPKKLMPLSKVVKFMAPKSKTPPPPLPSPPPAQHKESRCVSCICCRVFGRCGCCFCIESERQTVRH